MSTARRDALNIMISTGHLGTAPSGIEAGRAIRGLGQFTDLTADVTRSEHVPDRGGAWDLWE